MEEMVRAAGGDDILVSLDARISTQNLKKVKISLQKLELKSETDKSSAKTDSLEFNPNDDESVDEVSDFCRYY